jgi:uncharacterized protein (TIRG00374 family)
MIGIFYNNFFPGGVGGDLIRIYYLKRKEKISIPEGSAITLFDRFLGMSGLVFVAFFSMWLISRHSDFGSTVLNENPFLLTLTIICPIVIIAVVLMLFLLKIPKVYKLLELVLSKLLFGSKMISFMNTFQIIVKNTKTLLITFAICIFGHIITLISISIVAYILYPDIQSVYATMAVAGVAILTSVVPITPGNIGVTEGVADILYSAFGIRDGAGATIFALWRVITALFSLTGGIFYLYYGSGQSIKADMKKDQEGS